MKGYKTIAILTVLTTLLVSCTKEINVNIPDAETKVVVQGVIENGEHPYVILTRSASYFAPIQEWLDSIFILDATVIISDGSTTDTAMMEVDNNVMAPLPYFVYRSHAITGEVGKTYSLKVIALGKTITASTTIPNPVPLDSLWFEIDPGSHSDSLGFVWARLNDPPELGNYYAWFSKVLGQDARFLAPGGYTFDDKFFNGQSIPFPYQRPRDPVNPPPDDPNAPPSWYFITGDTVAIKFCTMDYYHYEYLDRLEALQDGGDNPFGTPAVLPTNLSDGALGYWGGFACTYDTVVCIPQP